MHMYLANLWYIPAEYHIYMVILHDNINIAPTCKFVLVLDVQLPQ